MSQGIQLSVQPVEEAITVSGSATGAQPPPNGVTIDFLPAGGGASVRLVTNLQATDGTFSWSGSIPGYATIPAGSQVQVFTNRQISQTIPV